MIKLGSESNISFEDSLIDSRVIIAYSLLERKKEKGSIGVDFQRELESVLNDALSRPPAKAR